jgi:hypothetical protein
VEPIIAAAVWWYLMPFGKEQTLVAGPFPTIHACEAKRVTETMPTDRCRQVSRKLDAFYRQGCEARNLPPPCLQLKFPEELLQEVESTTDERLKAIEQRLADLISLMRGSP